MLKLIAIFGIGSAMLFSLTIPAEARQWTKVAKGGDSVSYIDVGSITGTGDIRYFWEKIIRIEDSIAGYRRNRSTLIKSWVNCKTRQTGSSQIVVYDEKGNVVSSTVEISEPEDWTSVLPDTLGESTLEKVCKLKTTKSDRALQSQTPNLENLGQDRAAFLVKRWLQAKGKIFALHPDRQLALQLTTGKLYKDLTQPNGQLDWLENHGAFYEYGVQNVEQVTEYNESSTRLVVQAYVIEDSRVFQGDLVIKSSGGPERLLVKYEFAKAGKSWKLEDLKVLEIQAPTF